MVQAVWLMQQQRCLKPGGKTGDVYNMMWTCSTLSTLDLGKVALRIRRARSARCIATRAFQLNTAGNLITTQLPSLYKVQKESTVPGMQEQQTNKHTTWSSSSIALFPEANYSQRVPGMHEKQTNNLLHLFTRAVPRDELLEKGHFISFVTEKRGRSCCLPVCQRQRA